MRIGFLGLGLVGGSIARALRQEAPDWMLSAWSPRGAGPRQALAAGVIAAAPATIEGAVEGADLVVLAAPPTECLALLDELAGPCRPSLGPDAVITDVASTKAAIVAHAGTLGLRFVGGHPMAGREAAGFAESDPEMLRGRPWVLVPRAGDGPALRRVAEMAARAGARPLTMDAATHDALVAGISHMPLMLSAALVEAVAGTGDDPRPDWPDASALAAGGWASMTRLARGDVTMGAGIAATNAPAIAARLRDVRAAIDDWLEVLEAPSGPDEIAIHARLAAARARLIEGGA